MKSKSQKLLYQNILQVTFGLVACIATLTGCSVGPDFLRPDNELNRIKLQPRDDYASNYRTSATAVPVNWWSLFNDNILTELEEKAFAANLDLQIVSSRIEQSRAQLGIAASELQPSLGVGASYAREALSEHGKFAALGAPTTASSFYQIGFDAVWELDLWSRARRVKEGAMFAFEATIYEREAAKISLSAEVARAYLQLRGIQAQLKITEQNKVIAEHALSLAESRERNGVATRYETSSARAQLARVNAIVPELTQRRNVLMNSLALLLGAEPRALDAQLRHAISLPSLPREIPVGISSELAHRRPDILRAEAQLHAATASIGVAKADFYPRIGLKGRIGVEAFEHDDLSSWDSRFFSVGPTIYLPIFQGGQLVQRLALTESKQKTAALIYRQTVLQAWHEVDNALDAWAAQQRQHAELLISYEQSQQALQVAERGYREGASDYLSVLIAQRDLLTTQTSLNTSATQATLTLVNLYKALGGGWDLEEVNSITKKLISASENTEKRVVALPLNKTNDEALK